ncbi:MAG: RdgB/HAM1 family non-canonical purine NTP pyrophosphatase [Butyrivibrio sp.]|uniref:RdgB/HAM1 family non-canonical purine NTP pyrophosphatase n=1 Tax=Butyrivibrio sp. TaxID=28121 RepID=UPI0025EDE118|nr:RdgB/HAM1 family non-canonical purine NTP pyrophosphatase [Butyrivibrio sp.]MCR5771106.1 RdgB/HAM1 family non-canonical purine NTP pyrophosphatase [Butyrivibrio sp.]
MRIVFATGNKDKMREIRQIMGHFGMEIVSMKEAGVFEDIEENGTSFKENSVIKASAIADVLIQKGDTDSIVLADDSGLEIDALSGEPGIYSARYMGKDTPYPEKNAKILERLKDVPDDKRSARFVCAVSAVLPDKRVLTCQETMEGIIGHEIAGENGFGYDPIFFLPKFSKTSAQLTPEEKNSISHRGKALRAMEELLSKELAKD